MLAIFFILGLIIGSFLNVVICRLDLAETIIHGRSHCPKCKAQIYWYDNIPVISFVMLRAKCRECMESISWQYPFIEILTGIIFLLVGNYFFEISSVQAWVITLFYLVIFSLMIVIIGYDIKFMEIPMAIFWAALIVLIFLYLVVDWNNLKSLSNENFWNFFVSNGFLGGIVAAAFFYFLVFVSKERWMGMGDVYVGFLVGFLVGFPNVLVGLLMSFTTGAIFGIMMMILKKGNLKTQIPFAPFLILGGIVTLFLARELGQFYYLSLIWPS